MCDMESMYVLIFLFQAEDGIRDLVRSRGLGDVYKRQGLARSLLMRARLLAISITLACAVLAASCSSLLGICLLYTSDAADERSSVDLGGRRIIKKKKPTYCARVLRMNINTHPRTQS
mgnify:CR=1 FL=1